MEGNAMTGQEVRISTVDGRQHVGHLYALDPVTRSMVVANKVEGESDGQQKVKITWFNGDGIKAYTCDQENPRQVDDLIFALCRAFTPHFQCHSEGHGHFTPEAESRRREHVYQWLVENRFEPQMSPNNQDIHVLGDVLIISPPYVPESCYSKNEIILERIQALLRNCRISNAEQ